MKKNFSKNLNDKNITDNTQRFLNNIKSWETILEGLSYGAKIVGTTYGAEGRNIFIKNKNEELISTNDGVTVMSKIQNTNTSADIGLDLLKQTSKRTDDEAGDGTTLTILLTTGLANGLWQHVERHGLNATSLI